MAIRFKAQAHYQDWEGTASVDEHERFDLQEFEKTSS